MSEPFVTEKTDWSAPSVREHIETLIDGLQAQIDRRIDTQLREREETKQELENKIDAVDRVTQVSLTEIDKRLTQAMGEADQNLSRHIAEQIASVKAALEQQQLLAEEKERRLTTIHEASQKAIEKSEQAIEKRLEILNGIRQSLADQNATFVSREVYDNGIEQARRERDQMREDIRLTLAREEFYKTLEEWTEWRRLLETRMASQDGAQAHQVRYEEKRAVTMGQIIAVTFGISGVLATVAAILVGAFT